MTSLSGMRRIGPNRPIGDPGTAGRVFLQPDPDARRGDPGLVAKPRGLSAPVVRLPELKLVGRDGDAEPGLDGFARFRLLIPEAEGSSRDRVSKRKSP